MSAPNLSEKPYTLSFQDRPGYLYAYVEGDEDGYEVSRAYWQEVADEVRRSGVKQVLIDENITGNGTIADAFRFGSELPGMGFGRTRIAFVDRHLDQDEVNRFGELVALNRGMNARVFNDLPEAEAWLLKK
jgi:hypothetical protein